VEKMQNRKSKLYKELLSWAKTIGAAFVIALLINNCLIVNASVESGSMESTIMTGDRVLCNRLAYLSDSPARFDVIVFNFREDGKRTRYVKRVIGLPGEKVEIIDGGVYINDSSAPLADEFVNDSPCGDYGPYLIPEGCYFVLGDNRNHSFDSKLWSNPYLSEDDILGKVFCAYYPEWKSI